MYYLVEQVLSMNATVELQLVASSVFFFWFQHKIARIFLTNQWILHTYTFIMTERVIVTMWFLWNFSKFSLSFSLLFSSNRMKLIFFVPQIIDVMLFDWTWMACRWERLSELCQIHEIEGRTRWKKKKLIAKNILPLTN